MQLPGASYPISFPQFIFSERKQNLLCMYFLLIQMLLRKKSQLFHALSSLITMLLNGNLNPLPSPPNRPQAFSKAWFPEQTLIPFLPLSFLTFGKPQSQFLRNLLSGVYSSPRRGWRDFPIYCDENEEADVCLGARVEVCVCVFVSGPS